MKKILAILLAIVIVATAFVACSKNDSKDNETTTTTGITTDDAKIKEADAVNLMQSYSAKELGIDEKELKDCSFMVASSGEKLEEQKAYYVKVIAVIKNAHEDPETKEITYTFDYKGEYYIRYDGKQILSKDVKTGEFTEMKVKAVPTTSAPTTHSQEEIEAAKNKN